MTLADMADYVCEKVRQRDAAAVTQCKAFLKARYNMLYADQLWRASLYTLAFEVPGSYIGDFNPNIVSVGEQGMYFMPESVDRTIAVRREDAEMEGIDELELFRGDFDRYTDEDSAGAVKFSILSPAVFWNPSPNIADQQLRLVVGGSGDEAQTIVSKWTTDKDEPRRSEGVATSHTFGGSEDAAFRLVESITHPVLAGALELQFDETLTGNWVTVARSIVGSNGFVPRQRIRIYPKPGTGAASATYTALVKRKCLELDDDNASPALAGIENCLMCFGESDMLKRARQYGKSQVAAQEGLALLEQFKRVEVVQQSARMRIMPSDGEIAGSLDYGFSGKGSW